MTLEEWRNSSDPQAMIGWLFGQGKFQPLWDFTTGTGVRVRNLLPGAVFRRVVRVAELTGQRNATWRDVDLALTEAADAINLMDQALRRSKQLSEQERLKRQLLLGRTVLAFQCSNGGEAAAFMSQQLLEWTDDPAAEQSTQAELLRKLVPDPSFHLDG